MNLELRLDSTKVIMESVSDEVIHMIRQVDHHVNSFSREDEMWIASSGFNPRGWDTLYSGVLILPRVMTDRVQM